MKIKIQEWKEVVRLEIIEGDIKRYTHSDGSYGIEINEYKFYFLAELIGNIFIFSKQEFSMDLFMEVIEEYNNSIKDDGYKWVCDGCDDACKSKYGYRKTCYSFDRWQKQANWQPIQNNKIEVVG